ncbi:hypothetical protein FBEOM_5274 [Fusarium beomiforme]|uniref:Ubiquitin 3 binding protein But2 C-terminal domain-containing protein n=1 Tax=Fusarium beomiforme TaxID=44412 RepID=A0A9P5AN04_9HYPO|nr:hypothetical protein FBEOM_5274 [Fusarium beomiforme]
MRFSQSLSFFLASAQAGIALAGLCKPSPTTTAAVSTITSAVPQGTPIKVTLSDGTTTYTYLSPDLVLSSRGTTPALFTLEQDGRLTTVIDGTTFYLKTVIPAGPQLSFSFDTYQNIQANPYRFFVKCEVVSGLLSCESENGNTPIYWHIESNNVFYGNENQLSDVTTAEFSFQ